MELGEGVGVDVVEVGGELGGEFLHGFGSGGEGC